MPGSSEDKYCSPQVWAMGAYQGVEAGNVVRTIAQSGTDEGDLSVNAQAAMIGSYSLQAAIDDNNQLFVTDWSPYNDTIYIARFYFDPNSIEMGNDNTFSILELQDQDFQTQALLNFGYTNGDYWVQLEMFNDQEWSNASPRFF